MEGNGNEGELYFGPFRLNPLKAALWRGEQNIHLTPKEIKVLLILAEGQGAIPAEALKKAWRVPYVETNSLHQVISQLRRKLGKDENGLNYIRLEDGGYRLAAVVTAAAPPPPQQTNRTAPPAQPEPDARPPKLQPIDPAPPEQPKSLSEHPGRSFLVMSRLSLIGATVAAAILMTFLLLASRVPQAQPDPIPPVLQLTHDGRLKEGPILFDGTRLWFRELVRGEWKIVSVSSAGGDVQPWDLPFQEFALLGAGASGSALLLEYEDAPGQRVWSWPLGGGSPQLLPFLAGYAAWSPKRKTFAAARDDVLEFYREGRLIRQMRTPLGTSPMYPHWRPDGAHITFCLGNSRAYRSTLQLATPESDRMLPIARNEVVGDDQPFGSWTKDGRYFVFTAGSLELHDLWAVPDPASSSRPNLVQPRRLTNHSLNWRYPAPGNQTNELYAIGETRRPELVRLAADGGEWRPYLDRDGIPAYELDSSRDAQLVTYVSYPDYRLWISRADGTERHQLAWPDFEVHQPHWSPDGKRIAFMGKPEDKWRVEIVDVAMDHWQEPIPDGEDQGVPTWVDDNIIVYGDWPTGDPRQVMRLHVIDLQRRQSSVIPGSDGLWTVRCSPDGKYLSALRRDMTQRSNALLVSRWGSSDWREILSREDFAEQTWSRDSRHLQVMDTGELLRVDAFTGRAEKLADLHNFPYTSEQWFGIAPDGSPLALLSVQVQEIYSVSWRP